MRAGDVLPGDVVLLGHQFRAWFVREVKSEYEGVVALRLSSPRGDEAATWWEVPVDRELRVYRPGETTTG